ncbi:MAG TPA: hypothetical protein VKG24_10850 [Pseudolabrys sp.]|jgi:hypothetical protein|nr:hypothetical protein [Pseudolabrys sp.]
MNGLIVKNDTGKEVAMYDFAKIEQTDEAVLVCDVSDVDIENAAGSLKEKAGAFTLAFCSGFDTCPS